VCNYNKNHKAYKETGKDSPFKEKNQQKLSEKDLMEDILSKYFKTTVLKMFKELKKDVEKVKKILCEQNGNTNK